MAPRYFLSSHHFCSQVPLLWYICRLHILCKWPECRLRITRLRDGGLTYATFSWKPSWLSNRLAATMGSSYATKMALKWMHQLSGTPTRDLKNLQVSIYPRDLSRTPQYKWTMIPYQFLYFGCNGMVKISIQGHINVKYVPYLSTIFLNFQSRAWDESKSLGTQTNGPSILK